MKNSPPWQSFATIALLGWANLSLVTMRQLAVLGVLRRRLRSPCVVQEENDRCGGSHRNPKVGSLTGARLLVANDNPFRLLGYLM